MKNVQKYTQATYYFDSNHQNIQEFVAQNTSSNQSSKEKAVQLYYAIRDGWRYHPYKISLQEKDYCASNILSRKEAHCIDKSTLFLTCCRAAGIPALLCLAKVKNHIGVEKIVEQLGTDELVPHGYAEVFIEDKWVKATPVFNKELCAKLNVEPLPFDGETDAIFQEFDKEGGTFMEYLEEFGTYADLPHRFICDTLVSYYPKIKQLYQEKGSFSFQQFG